MGFARSEAKFVVVSDILRFSRETKAYGTIFRALQHGKLYGLIAKQENFSFLIFYFYRLEGFLMATNGAMHHKQFK